MQYQELMWWAYLHSNGSWKLKRWFGDPADYTTDCEDNPFVIRIISPFAAKTREEALALLEEKIS